jgi:hypothetical protein
MSATADDDGARASKRLNTTSTEEDEAEALVQR